MQSYNDTVASLESRVFTTARRLVDLKVTTEELEAPKPIELVARKVQKSELVASANESLVALRPPMPDPLFDPCSNQANTRPAERVVMRDGPSALSVGPCPNQPSRYPSRFSPSRFLPSRCSIRFPRRAPT